jgi:hypothetical protein
VVVGAIGLRGETAAYDCDVEPLSFRGYAIPRRHQAPRADGPAGDGVGDG